MTAPARTAIVRRATGPRAVRLLTGLLVASVCAAGCGSDGGQPSSASGVTFLPPFTAAPGSETSAPAAATGDTRETLPSATTALTSTTSTSTTVPTPTSVPAPVETEVAITVPPEIDPTTGLTRGPSGVTPASAVPPASLGGTATLTIQSPSRPIDVAGGTCSVIDGTTYITAGEPGGANGVLSFVGSLAAQPYLGWQLAPQQASTADPTTLVVVLDAGGRSGTFTGTAPVPPPPTVEGAPPTEPTLAAEAEAISGSFTCDISPMVVVGEHGVTLIDVTCDLTGGLVVSGTAGDAAALWIDPTGIAGDGSFTGALSWRSAGVEYRTTWLRGLLAADGTGATFVALVVAPDGARFSVTGGFQCG